ncbi:flagellar biosynthetic protein FliO [Clostridium sp.]|uniref:flagellar biosynthetic protein FliO n=1 Tax=Clostridium sp. TaxID=1506 RepID=UPI0032174E91
MDSQLIMTLLKLVIFFPLVIGLILWLGKTVEKYSHINRKSTMRVIERLTISKDNSLLIVKIGDKFYLVTSAQGKIEIVEEVEGENYKEIEMVQLKNSRELKQLFKDKYLKLRK